MSDFYDDEELATFVKCHVHTKVLANGREKRLAAHEFKGSDSALKSPRAARRALSLDEPGTQFELEIGREDLIGLLSQLFFPL